MTRVLVGIDGSDLSVEAARRAVRLFGDDAMTTLLWVVRPPAMTAASGAGPGALMAPDPALVEEATDALEVEATRELEGIAGDLRSAARTRVAVGEPGPELCAVAERDRFDVIVVGSHGRGLLKRALLGSVSHHVTHHAPCPVLVVRDLHTKPH